MALNIPEWPNPFDPNQPLVNAYGYNAGLGIDVSQATASVTLNVHPSEGAWAGQPVGQLQITTGQVLVQADPEADPPQEEVRVKTLAELMQDPEFAAAYATIGAKLYQEWLKHPALAGATIT